MDDTKATAAAARSGWPALLYRLADDVDLGLPARAVADALRSVAGDMCTERRRAQTVTDIAGGSSEPHGRG